MPAPVRLAFLGCGFITRVHSRHVRALGGDVVPSYASRDRAKAEAFRAQFGGQRSYGDYQAALADPDIDAVVVAVPPKFHLDLTLEALSAGKHVLVEKPAFPALADYRAAQAARNRAGRVVIVGENDHYKPLTVRLRRLLAEGVIGDMVFAHFTTIAHRLKAVDDWRNDETMAGGDAFFEEGIHWLHVAGSLGPVITEIRGFRPSIPSSNGPDRRAKSMMVAFRYDNGAVGSLYYSREVPSLLRGLRLSKIFGRKGHHHVRIERGVRAGPRRRDAAGVPARLPRHPRVSGDVPGFRLRDPEGTRARDEPRASHGRSAPDGARCRLRMTAEHFDIVIIGSGVGGGTMARALAPTGARILVAERGDFVPSEPQNWDPAAVWKDLRYRSTEQWIDGGGKAFTPYMHYCVGGNSKFWGSVLYRLRREDFGPLEHADGLSPGWPIDYETLAPYYDRARAVLRSARRSGSRSHRAAARTLSSCRDTALARDGRHRRATARHGAAPVVAAARPSTTGRAGRMRALPNLQLVSVPDRREERCGGVRHRAGRRAHEHHAVDAGAGPAARDRCERRTRDGGRARSQGRAPPRRGVARGRVMRRGQFGRAASQVRFGSAPRRVGECVRASRSELHGASGDHDAGLLALADQPGRVSEDRRDQRLLSARSGHALSARPHSVARADACGDGQERRRHLGPQGASRCGTSPCGRTERGCRAPWTGWR